MNINFSFFQNFFSSVQKKITQNTQNSDSDSFHVRDIPEGSIIQIFDEQKNLYEFTVHDHTRDGSFVKFTKFNDEHLLGEVESKVMHPRTFPASKFSIEMNNYKEGKEYSIQNIKHIKILEKI